MKSSCLGLGLLLQALVSIPAALAADAPDLRIDYIGYDVASGDLVIQGEGFVDAAHPAAPTIRISGRTAEVTAYSESLVTARLPWLPAGERSVTVSRVSGSAHLAVSSVSDALWPSAPEPLTFNEQHVRSGGE